MRTRLRGEDGFSMVEMLVAITILAIVLAFTAGGVTSALGLTRTNRSRTVAANLATEQMELQRSLPFAEHVEGIQPTQEVQVNGVPYQVTVTKGWTTQSSTTGSCDVTASGTSAEIAYMAVDVAVAWPQQGEVPPVRSHTVITPPAAQYSPYRGHVVVKVIDRDAAPVPAVTVRMTGGPDVPPAKRTGFDGCAVFPLLRAGGYTVEIEQAGYVSSIFQTGAYQQAVAEPVDVQVGQTQNVLIEYNQAAFLDLRLEGRAGGARPATPGSLPVTIAHRSIQPSGVFTQNVSSRLTATVFPFEDGYEFWAGDPVCADQRPDPATAVVPQPGAPADPQQLLASLRVRVVTPARVPVPGYAADLRATSTVCSGISYDFPITTDLQGYALVALPYGEYDLSAVGVLRVGRPQDARVRLTSTGTQPFDATLRLNLLGGGGGDDDDDDDDD